jgi:hypothetical protein
MGDGDIVGYELSSNLICDVLCDQAPPVVMERDAVEGDHILVRELREKRRLAVAVVVGTEGSMLVWYLNGYFAPS